MNNKIKEYVDLIDLYLSKKIVINQFQTQFMDKFKAEASLDNVTFMELDKFFSELDSFSDNPELLNSNSSFYLNESQLLLRTKALRVNLILLAQSKSPFLQRKQS